MGKWCSACLPWFGLELESNKDDEEGSSPHLTGPGPVAEYSAQWEEREVITVVKLTGNVASPWRLVMIAAAGNNKNPTLHNYWPASLPLDKSNNAHYPHVPLLYLQKPGSRGSKWDLLRRKLCRLTVMIDWRKTSCSAARCDHFHSLPIYQFVSLSYLSVYLSWFD